MLINKKVRMLELLNKQVSNCNKCLLHNNGTAIPYWSKHSKYVIIGEAPGYNEVRRQTPFVGAAGNILTTELSNAGFNSKDFLIINTVQCRPVSGTGNGKPNESQIKSCQDYLRKYIKVINPEKILCLGNYAKYIFTGNYTGILSQRGSFNEYSLEGSNEKYPVLFTVHPAYCIYNREEGIPLLRRDIKLFKDTKFERKSDWLLSEEDFRI